MHVVLKQNIQCTPRVYVMASEHGEHTEECYDVLRVLFV